MPVQSSIRRGSGERSAQPERYEFPSRYQLKILAIALRDRSVLPKYVKVIRPEFFSSPVLKDTAALIVEFFERHRAVPSPESLDQLVLEHVRQSRGQITADAGESWRRLVGEMLDMDVADGRAVLETVVRWARRQSFKQAVLACSDIWESAERGGEEVDFESGLALMHEAASVGVDETSHWIDYFGDSRRRLTSLQFDDGAAGKIPLLMPGMDKLLGGGVDRGEMLVWAGPPSRGKSALLIWTLKAALYMRLNVVLFSCEMSGIKLARRMDRCITGMTQAQQASESEKAERLIERLRSYRGRLFIVDLFGKDATVENVRGNIERLREEHGFSPDLIAVDYPGEMRGSRRQEQRRHELAEIYRDLRALGKEQGAVMHVPMQMNRGSLTKRVVSIEDLAECFEVAGIADVIVGICQTSDEKEREEIRLFMAKNRDGAASYSVKFRFKAELSQFVQMDDPKFTRVGPRDLQENQQGRPLAR